jgi:20S proteasome alpha/beta subunit
MTTLVVHPKTLAQEKAVKAVLEAMDIAFDKIEAGSDSEEVCILPPHVIDAIKISEEEFKNGKFYTNDEVKNELRGYL